MQVCCISVKAAKHEDSPSTRFMKAMGYEGIDVRGFKGLDNTTYGSVIYDLKGEDLARKKAIGTAKYSLYIFSLAEGYAINFVLLLLNRILLSSDTE